MGSGKVLIGGDNQAAAEKILPLLEGLGYKCEVNSLDGCIVEQANTQRPDIILLVFSAAVDFNFLIDLV